MSQSLYSIEYREGTFNFLHDHTQIRICTYYNYNITTQKEEDREKTICDPV